MNHRRVVSLLGLVLFALAGAQLVPLLWCIAPADPDAARGFALSALATAALGSAFRYFGNQEGELYRREGVLLVASSWLLASLTGALPYLIGGAIDGTADALFEATSGFTTTGASILADIEALSPSMLFWRSMTQWLGGIGIVVLFVALLAEIGAGARFLFALEVPGPQTEIMQPRVKQTALALFRIYLGLSAAQVLAMLACGASFYDAVVHTFSTIATGGFSPYQNSVGHLSPLLQSVVLVFMLVSGMNFAIHYALVRQRSFRPLRDTEIGVYGLLVVVGVVAVAWNLSHFGLAEDESTGSLLLGASFQVVSILTGTGFATRDFGAWPALSQLLLVAFMFVGGCAGSTTGGVKIIRVLVGVRAALREVRLVFSPNSVIAVTVGARRIPEGSVSGAVALLVLWVLGWGVGAVLLAIGDVSLATAATASLATLSNVGPGLGGVGPMYHYTYFADWQKLVMAFLMLLGRLEFFALIALSLAPFWRR